jgi:DnaK suppressor protein
MKGNTMTEKAADIQLPQDYSPTNEEEFMNPTMQKYFKKKLLEWKEQIIREAKATIDELQSTQMNKPDMVDRAAEETDKAMEFRARDRERKLLGKIDAALAKIESGDYGYCQDTDEPINVKRLDARPIATLSLEAQEEKERRERR